MDYKLIILLVIILFAIVMVYKEVLSLKDNIKDSVLSIKNDFKSQSTDLTNQIQSNIVTCVDKIKLISVDNLHQLKKINLLNNQYITKVENYCTEIEESNHSDANDMNLSTCMGSENGTKVVVANGVQNEKTISSECYMSKSDDNKKTTCKVNSNNLIQVYEVVQTDQKSSLTDYEPEFENNNDPNDEGNDEGNDEENSYESEDDKLELENDVLDDVLDDENENNNVVVNVSNVSNMKNYINNSLLQNQNEIEIDIANVINTINRMKSASNIPNLSLPVTEQHIMVSEIIENDRDCDSDYEPEILSNKLISVPINVSVAEPVSVQIAEPVSVQIAEPINVPVAEPINVPTAEPISVQITEPINEKIQNVILEQNVVDEIKKSDFEKTDSENDSGKNDSKYRSIYDDIAIESKHSRQSRQSKKNTSNSIKIKSSSTENILINIKDISELKNILEYKLPELKEIANFYKLPLKAVDSKRPYTKNELYDQIKNLLTENKKSN
jgi:hypothetical protein